MVSVLCDRKKGFAKAKEVHSFLTQELKLPVHGRPNSPEAFAAFVGMMRCCNPLRAPRSVHQKMSVLCPIVQRFPEVLTGKLVWYKDVHVALEDVIEKGGAYMDVDKMWRLMLWIFLGNGGNRHKAWHRLQHTPCGKAYREKDKRQPLEVLRYVIHAVHKLGGLMQVIGSDGLDKKSRLAKGRILYLLEWHEAVPRLVKAFHEGAQAFSDVLNGVRGLRGDLTRKEVLILLAASKFKAIASVGAPGLPFGQGAKNGAMAFLGVPMMHGAGATEHYHKKLTAVIPKLEDTIKRLFPMLPPKLRSVTLGDIEVCLCAAFVYAGLTRNLRKLLGPDQRGLVSRDPEATWEAVEQLRVPAGFYTYSPEGKPSTEDRARLPRISYGRLRLHAVPPKRYLTKDALLRRWGPAPPTNGAEAKRRRQS